MSSQLGSFEKILRVGEGRRMKRLAEQAAYITSIEPEFRELSDDQLRDKTVEFRQRLENGEELEELLFEAFAAVRARRPGLRLVLTGWDKAAPDGVEARGRVPPDELVRLYRTAAALVFPSLYEGFGQPPLEAMACGCPVASSNAASLPEVVGDSARLFDPLSVEDMAAAIEDVLDAPNEWARRGLERAARFSWDECARRHEAVYRELAG